MSLTEGSRLRDGSRFMRSPDPGVRYDVVCVEQVPISGNGHFAGQPLCYLASCDGHHHAVAERLVTLLNGYGLVPNTLDLAVAAGEYQVWFWDPSDDAGDLDHGWERDGTEHQSIVTAQARAERLREAGHRVQVRIVGVLEEK